MPEKITGTIITDCYDDNARGRQMARFDRLFGEQPTFIGVGGHDAELEAAGNLLDVLDALNTPVDAKIGGQSIVLVNVAPRGDRARDPKWNGTPFGYLKIGNTTVFSTYGRALSLVRSLGLAESINLFDLPSVTAAAVEWGDLTLEQAKQINNTQFRSYEFLPLAAWWLTEGRPVPVAEVRSLDDVAGHPNLAWKIDNFGNVKTNLLPREIGFEEGKQMQLVDGQTVTCIERLTNVPKGESALIIGSSGYGTDKLLEVVVQRGKAAERHNLQVGSQILKQES